MGPATQGSAAQRWTDQLAAWAIPQHILDAAPESPWHFPPALFNAPTRDEPDTPSRRRAREAVPEGGTVLDVGTGGGAAGLPLSPPASLITGLDESEDMLASFATRAEERGIPHAEVQGSWPEASAVAPIADVVVSHHVLYNVADVGPFALALTDHARERVVVEISARHPMTAQAPLWMHFHGLERPSGPTADDAIAVLREIGLNVETERSEHEPRPQDIDRATRVAFMRRRLCLPAEKDPEIDGLLPDHWTRDVVTIWWPGRAAREEDQPAAG